MLTLSVKLDAIQIHPLTSQKVAEVELDPGMAVKDVKPLDQADECDPAFEFLCSGDGGKNWFLHQSYLRPQ